MAEYILKIGKIDQPVEVSVGKAKKAILEVRDALREADIEADVIIKSEPKILN